MDSSALKGRVDQLLRNASCPARGADNYKWAVETFHGTVSVLSALYGQESEQIKSLNRIAEQTIIKNPGNNAIADYMLTALRGTLTNMQAELDLGLIGNLQKRFAGDVLTDFIQLARVILNESADDGKNVAAVLAAAAYEDTIRRMGAVFAGIVGRDDLSDVIDALKKSGTLVAPQLGIALSYLNFRNHALHANWDKIDLASVHSVLGFIEQLLLKHFA